MRTPPPPHTHHLIKTFHYSFTREKERQTTPVDTQSSCARETGHEAGLLRSTYRPGMHLVRTLWRQQEGNPYKQDFHELRCYHLFAFSYCTPFRTMLDHVRKCFVHPIFELVYPLYMRTFVRHVFHSSDHSVVDWSHDPSSLSNKRRQLFFIVMHLSGPLTDRFQPIT